MIRLQKYHTKYRFMSTSLSNLVDNLSEGLHSDKCTDCKLLFDFMSIKDNQLIFKCFGCKKNYKKDFNKELIQRFANIYKFCNKYINRFISVLRNGVNTWIIGRDLKRRYCLIKKLFTVT